MPTLRPQTISGLVVIPTVEQAEVWRVSIAINVGASGGGPTEVVTREELVVELIGPEGSFEPIASPDPGPLPVLSLRAAQAHGEFTFAPGAGQPTELRVALRGQRRSFPLADTSPEARGFRVEPKKGDDFPIPPDTDNFLELAWRKIRRFFRKIGRLIKELLKKPKCCVTRFEAPLNSRRDATAKSEFFEMEADFAASPEPCTCTCCEYRQFVRGAFRNAAGRVVPFQLPSGPLDPDEYQEDGVIGQKPDGSPGYYGHRDYQQDYDRYVNDGCGYRAHDEPGCPADQTLRAEFLGLIVDVCRGVVVEKRTWVVDL
jgi:hypothetical protein